MTVYKQMEVGCDGDDGDCEGEPGGRAATVAEARAIAKAHGWVCRSGKDYCPEHADRRGVLMATVRELVPGDRVEISTGEGATFVEQTVHPIWDSLRLVIWKLDSGAWSHDALRAEQEVGTVVPTTQTERMSRLRAALLGGLDAG